MDYILTKLFGWMDHAADNHKEMELGDFFSFAAYDITGEITFSKSFGFTEKGEDIKRAIATNEGMEIFLATFGFFRSLSYLICNPLTTWTELLPLGYLGGITKEALQERKANPDARFDICAHWFRALNKPGQENPYWNEGRLLASAIANLGAGSDTVSCGLQSFVYHLLRHPDGWQRIRDEIDAARKKGHCQDPVIKFEDAAKLPYLQAAIKEALRIWAPVPSMNPCLFIKFDSVISRRRGLNLLYRSFTDHVFFSGTSPCSSQRGYKVRRHLLSEGNCPLHQPIRAPNIKELVGA